MRGARRRRDKEQLVDLRGLQEVPRVAGFVLIHDRGRFTKVDLGMGVVVVAALKEGGGIIVEHLADADGVFLGVERADDAAEGGERREGVQRGDGGEMGADGV